MIFATGRVPGSDCGGETPEVMRVEGYTHLTPKGQSLRICQRLDEALTESLHLPKVMPTKAWMLRAE
jgi:hypothetical protein